jgi:hypothetical protein
VGRVAKRGSVFSGAFNRPERAARLAKGFTKVFSEAPAGFTLLFIQVRGKLILEVRIHRILGSCSANLVPYRTYTPLTQEYATSVTWHSLRRVKAQDGYLSSF